MEQKTYKIYFSESKEFKIGRWLPFGLVALFFFSRFFTDFLANFFHFSDESVILPGFFILFFLIIFVNKKFGRGDLIVDGNSLSFVKGGQELGRFPLDNNLQIKNVGRVSTGKHSYTTKFRIEHSNTQPLVFHFAKMTEMANFSSIMVTGGGKFFDKNNKPVEMNQMQTQFASDPLGVFFNKEKREKFSTAVKDYQNKNATSTNSNTGDSKANYAIGLDQNKKSNQSMVSPETFGQEKDNKIGEILRVVAIIILVVVGYIVIKQYF
ncbi:MAG TPA: hypothetical protein DEB09_03365 [Candidatus Magasanikbacteria bacterium]|nr:hypothetical protein [Candidatus Magasanikbacteria bacterium]